MEREKETLHSWGLGLGHQEVTSQEEAILNPQELAMPDVLHVEILGNRTGEERKGGERGKTFFPPTPFNTMSSI